MKTPFKAGERVRVYSCAGHSEIATIVEVMNEDGLKVKVHDGELFVHPKQCRRLVKRKRREWWLIKDRGDLYFHVHQYDGEPKENGARDEIVRVREVFKK